MAETSGFFNAEILGDGSYDRVYVAEQFASYFARFIGNGVFVTPATQLKVLASGNKMAVVVQVGDAYINGYWYRNDAPTTLAIESANGTTKRIDRVVLRLDFSTRTIYLDVIKGTSALTPIAPNLTRNSDVWELCLAEIKVGIAVTEITTADVKDTRNNNELCGYVSGVVSQIDTTGLFDQFTAEYNQWFKALKDDVDGYGERFTKLFDDWFDKIKGKLEEDAATSLQNQINILEESLVAGVYGFENKYTVLDGDNVVENFDDGRRIETFVRADGTIDQYYYMADGTLRWHKHISEDKDGNMSEVVTTR